MTAFGEQPERDRLHDMSGAEDDAWLDIAAGYGEWADPDTAIRTNIEVVKELPSDLPAPMGYGIGKVEEARKALAEARKSQDTQAILDANNAWMDLADDLKPGSARRLVLLVAVLAGLGGFAAGFGLAALIIGLVGA